MVDVETYVTRRENSFTYRFPGLQKFGLYPFKSERGFSIFLASIERKRSSLVYCLTALCSACQSIRICKGKEIHHFHIDHNAPRLPDKTLHNYRFDLPWDNCNALKKMETMVMQNSGG